MAKRKPAHYKPSAEVLAAWPEGVSGNAINGLDETAPRRASPMFWHPADLHPFGELQTLAAKSVRSDPRATAVFAEASEHPALVPVATQREPADAAEWTRRVEEFALAHEADLVGMTTMKDRYVFEGYDIPHPNVIVMGVAHDYEQLSQVPSTPDNAAGVIDVGRQYARGTRAAFALANWIRSQGYDAEAFPGPRASALLLIPAAIDAGLGELGKHGSMINRTYGSGFRLAGVTTNMPLEVEDSAPDEFGVDDFCSRCQVCTRACPPDAILPEKQMVRGDLKWYVDFDKCIPYFAENASCGICIAVCPWTLPGVADNLLLKLARRRERQGSAGNAAAPG